MQRRDFIFGSTAIVGMGIFMETNLSGQEPPPPPPLKDRCRIGIDADHGAFVTYIFEDCATGGLSYIDDVPGKPIGSCLGQSNEGCEMLPFLTDPTSGINVAQDLADNGLESPAKRPESPVYTRPAPVNIETSNGNLTVELHLVAGQTSAKGIAVPIAYDDSAEKVKSRQIAPYLHVINISGVNYSLIAARL